MIEWNDWKFMKNIEKGWDCARVDSSSSAKSTLGRVDSRHFTESTPRLAQSNIKSQKLGLMIHISLSFALSRLHVFSLGTSSLQNLFSNVLFSDFTQIMPRKVLARRKLTLEVPIKCWTKARHDPPRRPPSPPPSKPKEVTLRLILGREDIGPLDVVSANQLSPEMRLLHSIVTHILFLKINRFDFLFERDIIIMHCILVVYPFNLPKLMISYMIEGSTKKNACLPYDMILTLIFKEFGVPISDEEPKRLLCHTDVYST